MMRLVSFKIVDCRRFDENIHTITWNIQEGFNFILGTNGSGKSSLVMLMNPKAPAPVEFGPEGKRVYVLEDNGKTYTLTSKYGKKAVHTFDVNGEALCENATAKVFDELVETHLGYTDEIHKIITGKNKFSTMSEMDRKRWMMEMSGMDLKFVNELYGLIKDELRDRKGAYRLVKKKYDEYADKTPDKEMIKVLEIRINTAKKELTDLMYHRDPSALPLASTTSSIETIHGDINKVYDILKRAEVPRPIITVDCNTAEELSIRLGELQAKRNNLDKEKQDVLVQLDNCNKLEAQVADLDGRSVDSLRKELVGIDSELNKLRNVSRTFDFDLNCNPSLIYDACKTVELEITGLSGDSNFDDRIIPRDQWGEHEHVTNDLIRTKSHKLSKIEEIGDELTHMANADHVDCPNCNLEFVPGLDPSRFDKLKALISKLAGEVEELTEVIHGKTQIIEAIVDRRYRDRQLRDMRARHPQLSPLFNYIIERDFLMENRSMILSSLREFESNVRDIVTMSNLEESRGSATNALEIVKNIERLEGVTNSAVDLDAKYNQLNGAHGETCDVIGELTAYLKYISLVGRGDKSVQDKLGELDKLEASHEAATLNDFIDGTVGNMQYNLAKDTDTLEREKNVHVRIQNILLDMNSVKDELDVYIAAEKTLNANTGVIGIAIKGFIGVFVDTVNSLLSQIWEHPFSIRSCVDDNGKITYKFPMYIKGALKGKDPSEGSSAQKEVINLIYALTVMERKGMMGWCLFLDELTGAFDERHRANTTRFLQNLIETGRCGQIFYVSHDVMEYAGAGTADAIVLNADNITIPDSYNENVVITYRD